MKEPDVFRLQHMLDAAREARLFAKGYRREDLDRDRVLMLSLVKEVEIIGEAASKVSEEARAQLPGIEWRAIIGMRNRLIQIYYDIDLDVLWNTVTCDIPRLITELESLLTISAIAQCKRQRSLMKRGFPMGQRRSIQREELHERR
jgi:uncharacterized protein with HEPN domain